VIDESFLDFADEGNVPTVSDEATRRENVVVLKSLGKNFGLHGVRAGYAVTNVRLAARLRRELPSWNVNGMAELLIRELPHYWDTYEESRRRVVRDRVLLERRLRS
jgi:histidinol-phosphate/aromatic aminotransferase/cobyric acid decarboxylase-like protein